MATITVNVSDETADIFRARVCQTYGEKKGALGKALGEAMIDWAVKKQVIGACLKMLREGRDMGKILYKKREELYERYYV